MKSFARATKELPRYLIKKGFGRQLRMGVRTTTQRLFQLKQGVKMISGEDAEERKKRARVMIKSMEEQKRVSEALQDAYDIARSTRVGLRIVHLMGDHEIVLADFCDSPDDIE